MIRLTLPCIVFTILKLNFTLAQIGSNGDILVKIPQGELVGEWRTSFGGKRFASFQGVPFAQPPIGNNRFEEPKSPEPWKGTLQAKFKANHCLQWQDFGDNDTHIKGDEDCLYLNIYSAKISNDIKLPVIVYIHGGAFMFGSGVLYEPDFLMDKEVVAVTINYRLGPLGFLSTQDDVVPGNNGLKDQNMALKWIKKNIKYFGGNHKMITIMGMSAGGASVNFHLISESSSGIIQSAISESGTVCCPWVLQTKPKEKALEIGNYLGCPTVSSKKMIECLKTRPASSIVNTVPFFMPFIQAPFSPFAPVIEPRGIKNAFISQHPYELMKIKSIDVPWLVSITTKEGLFPAALYTQSKYLNDIEENWEQLAPYLFDFNDTISQSVRSEVIRKIKQYYVSNNKITHETFSKFTDALSDRHFVVPIEKCLRIQSSKQTFFYVFDYSGQTSLGKHLSKSDDNLGVSHGDITGYILLTDYMDPRKNERDTTMMKLMVNMIVNFANNGIPKFGEAEWPTAIDKSGAINYLQIIDPTKTLTKQSPHLGEKTFWDSLGLNEETILKQKLKNEL